MTIFPASPKYLFFTPTAEVTKGGKLKVVINCQVNNKFTPYVQNRFRVQVGHTFQVNPHSEECISLY